MDADDARPEARGAGAGDPEAGRLDVLIVGAGPAGLTAATYLSRFRRRLRVVDAGASRARWIPESHNCPGFPFGVSGDRLLDRFRQQAEAYGVQVAPGRIVALAREGNGFRATDGDGTAWRARCVLLATGIVDRMPDMADLEAAVASGALRLCAVCDGYEASDERIAVHGPGDEAIRHAVFLRTFSRAVTVLPTAEAPPSARGRELAAKAGVVLADPPASLHYIEGRGCRAVFADAPLPGGGRDSSGQHASDSDADAHDTHAHDTATHDTEAPSSRTQDFDTLYPVLGGDAQSALATGLGAEVDEAGALVVDAHLQTSIDGLYAAGDIVSALNQISVAVGHAAIAATAIHRRLPHNLREAAPKD